MEIKDNFLEMAHEKTEMVILSGRRDRRDISFKIGRTLIRPSKAVNYLGIMVGENLSFGKHVEVVTGKACAKLAALARIMPNIGGPSTAKRKMFYGIFQSLILYGAQVWHRVTATKKYRDKLINVQRKALLKVTSGYRTISSGALQIIAGIPPLDF